jgi:NADH-quinone oxidoreductase subunit N
MTAIPGPILLLVPLFLAAGITYLLRRWTILAALVAATTAGVLAFLCLRLPLDRSAFVLGQEVAFGWPVVVLGQTLQLNPVGEASLAFIFVLATAFYVLALITSQGRSFYPFSLAILALYAVTILLQAFALSLLMFALSAALAVFIIQGEQFGSVRGAQRYLLVSLLAVPLLLAAAWLVDPSLSGMQDAEMARRVLLPAALGFGLLLATFPFGTWMPAVAADAPPIVTAFVFTAGQAIALFLALVFLRDNPLILSDSATMTVIQLSGLVMCVSGGLMAAVQRDFGRLFGYAALSDLGVLVLALAAAGSQSVTLAVLHVVARSVSITLMATALAGLRYRTTTDSFDGLAGMARRMPVTTVGLMLGGLALAGFPLTAGFPIHWAVYRAVSGEQWLWTLLLMASSAGIVIGLLRGLNAMLGAPGREDLIRPSVLARIVILALALLTVVLGLFPQLLLDPVQTVAQAFPLF